MKIEKFRKEMDSETYQQIYKCELSFTEDYFCNDGLSEQSFKVEVGELLLKNIEEQIKKLLELKTFIMILPDDFIGKMCEDVPDIRFSASVIPMKRANCPCFLTANKTPKENQTIRTEYSFPVKDLDEVLNDIDMVMNKQLTILNNEGMNYFYAAQFILEINPITKEHEYRLVVRGCE